MYVKNEKDRGDEFNEFNEVVENAKSTVFPRIVSALDQYPPSNSVRTVCFWQ